MIASGPLGTLMTLKVLPARVPESKRRDLGEHLQDRRCNK
jgi:hypothetical protein